MNNVTLTGRLTADPELRDLPNGTEVCQLRLAVEGMGRGNEVGYIDVASYGPGGGAAARTLTKGWFVAVSGRIEWRSWETKDEVKRQAHSIVGQIEFLAALKDAKDTSDAAEPAEPGAPVNTGGDDDIPF